jgi:hypothetical protein
VYWNHFHGRSVEVLDTVIVDQSPLFVDLLVTPSLPATAGAPFCPPPPLGFALRYILRLSSCSVMEGFITPSLPHLAVEEIKLSIAPSLLPHYRTSSLLRAHQHPACLRPFSRVHSSRTDPAPEISFRGQQNFSSFHRALVTVSPPLPRRCELSHKPV